MPFVKKALIPPPVEAPRKTITQARQDDRKARQRAEAIALQLDAARESFTRLHEDCVKDESQDIMEIGTILTRAQETVSVLESTLRVARQQELAAEAQLATAGLEAEREGLRIKLTQLAAVGDKVDRAMQHLTEVVDELAPLLDEARGLGFDGLNVQLSSSALLFKVRLLESCHKMPGCRQGESWFLRQEPWSASLPAPGQAERAR